MEQDYDCRSQTQPASLPSAHSKSHRSHLGGARGLLFLHPHSSSPCRLPQATGAQKPLILLQLSCISALWSFPSSLPCRDSWLLSCSSLYGNFAFPHISCTGKAKAEKCLFIFSAANPSPRDSSHPTVPHDTPHAGIVL